MPSQIPQIPDEYFQRYINLPEEERDRRSTEALQHMKQFNETILTPLEVASQRMVMEDPKIYQRTAADTYMALRDHLIPMPCVSLEDLLAQDRQWTNQRFQEIADLMRKENKYLFKLVFAWADHTKDPVLHATGALMVYKLI